MKRVLTFVLIIFIVLFVVEVFAAEPRNITETNTTSQIIEKVKEKDTEIDKYIERYDNNQVYGMTAYVLKAIQVYSIPVCFLGIALGAIAQFILGIRKLDFRQRGSRMILAFVTVLVICQVLPLIFTIVVKGWR